MLGNYFPMKLTDHLDSLIEATIYSIMINGSIQEEDITIVNIYSPNIGASQCIRQTQIDIKGEIGSNT